MAACRAVASRISNRSAGDAACEGGPVGDDCEDGPQGCVWACTAAADGMVPAAGARQIDWITVPEFAYAKARLGKINMASAGNGTPATSDWGSSPTSSYLLSHTRVQTYRQ